MTLYVLGSFFVRQYHVMYMSWFLLPICENYKSRWEKNQHCVFLLLFMKVIKKKTHRQYFMQQVHSCLKGSMQHATRRTCASCGNKHINFVAYRKHEEITYPFLERHNLILNTKRDSNYETQRREIYKKKKDNVLHGTCFKCC